VSVPAEARSSDRYKSSNLLRVDGMTEAGASSVGTARSELDGVTIESTPTRWRSWSNDALHAVGKEASGGMPSSEWWRGED
jgi:hypothetical protein